MRLFKGKLPTVRAGWREGYSAEAGILCRSVEEAKLAIEAAADCTSFTTDTSSLLVEPSSEAGIDDRFDRIYSLEEQMWLEGEFSQFDRAALRRMAVKFGRSRPSR